MPRIVRGAVPGAGEPCPGVEEPHSGRAPAERPHLLSARRGRRWELGTDVLPELGSAGAVTPQPQPGAVTPRLPAGTGTGTGTGTGCPGCPAHPGAMLIQAIPAPGRGHGSAGLEKHRWPGWGSGKRSLLKQVFSLVFFILFWGLILLVLGAFG